MKRKLYNLTIALLTISTMVKAQTGPEIKSGEQAATAASTGTQQDLLSNYLQVAAKSVTSSNSGLQLKLNWFSLNADPNKYQDINYNKTNWQRNGEFVGFAGVKSWQLGLNFNLLNLRDTSRAHYEKAYGSTQDEETTIISATVAGFKTQVLPAVQTPLKNLIKGLYLAGKPVTDLQAQIDAVLPGLLQNQPLAPQAVQSLQNDLNDAIAKQPGHNDLPSDLANSVSEVSGVLTTSAINALVDLYSAGKTNNPFSSFITAPQLQIFQRSLDDQVKNNATLRQQLNATSLADADKKIKQKYDSLIKYVARQPLLTFGYLYNQQIGTGAPYHQAGLTYLMSFGSAQSTHIGQLNASLTDTLGSSDPTGKITNFDRNILAVQAGYNQVLIVQNKTSLAELNGALEEDKATSGYIASTATSKFYFDAYLRFRLPSTPWLKLNLKYDPKGGKVLGLLDFTYNLGQ